MSHYETLGVSKTADESEIKKAFRALAMKFHPDKNPGNSSAEKKFKEINEAYEILKDPQKRAAYDYENTVRKNQSWSNAPNWDDTFSKRRQYGNFSDDEILNEILRRARQNQPPARNKDTILRYTASLEDVFTGKEVELRYSTAKNPGKTIKINIPRSIVDGTKIRYAGMGDDTYANAPPGDLYVVISIAPNDRFIRNGDTLTTSVTIDFIDAILGVNKRIPCIDGSEINLRIHAGMAPSSHIRVPEKGLWSHQGTRGSMLVEVVMEQPTLNDAQRELLRKVKEL